MKKSMFLCTLVLMLGLSTFANNEETVSKKVMDAFNSEFVDARNVNWENSKSFSKATFSLNGQIMYAYYTFNGELLAVTRNLTSSQLPINLLSDFKKQYSGYWITDLFEMTNTDTTSYFLTLENGDYTLVLKSTGVDGWVVFKKERK